MHLQAFGAEGEHVASLMEALRERFVPHDGLSVVAEQGGRVVGHVLFSAAWLDAPRRMVSVQALSPLGVLPDYQRQGTGAALVRRGLDIMTSRSVPVVFLEGDPGFYRRFGFSPGATLGFRKPSLRIPDAAFQAITLPAYESWMTGTLVYPDILWQHDAVGLRSPGPDAADAVYREPRSGQPAEGHTMAQIEVKRWSADHYTPRAEKSRTRNCAQGGSEVCGRDAEFTIVYPNGESIATCPDHLITYVRTRIKDDN